MQTQTQAEIKAEHAARLVRLKTDRSSWEAPWRDITRYIRPRSSKWYNELPNSGLKKNSSIINGRPTLAARTLVAGIMAGLTSPSRPWFRLTTVDSTLSERDDIKTWLYKVEEIFREILLKSNLYNCLHQTYWDLALIGTAVMHLEEDDDTVLRGYVFPSGSYCLAQNERLEVDTLYREQKLTVRQLVRKFGIDAVSIGVADQYKRKEYEVWVPIVQCVAPNDDYEAGKLGPRGKKYFSIWFEVSGDPDKLLRVSGYEEQPFLGPRWERTGEDIYGNSPAMDAIGDARALQFLEKRKAQIIDKITNPPMKGPPDLATTKLGILPGEHTFVSETVTRYEPSYVVNPAALPAIANEIAQHEARLNEIFYANLWLLLSQSDGEMTAHEVIERREEKLLQLGPVVESLHTELLKPMFARIFGVTLRMGLLPRPPDDLAGKDLRIEYTSIMAQAQKLLGKTGLDSLFTFVAQAASINPQVVDKLDLDECVDQYATILGTAPVVVRPDDAVAQMRAQRAQQQQAQQQLEQAQQAAGAAKDLSGASLDNSNALSVMLRGVGAQ